MHRSATNRLDAVTIRIGLADDQTERAAEALGLPSIRPSRSTLGATRTNDLSVLRTDVNGGWQ